jgi:hypothetical protein
LRRPRSDALDDASAYIVDSRNDSNSSVTSTLAILFPRSETLLVFNIKRSAEGKVVLTPMQQISAIAAATVLATRSNVLDLIFVAPDQSWGLVNPGPTTESIIAPELMPQGKKIIRLEGDGSTNVTIIFEDHSRYITSVPSTPTGLALQCLNGLSLVLPLHQFTAFYNSLSATKASLPPGSTHLAAIEDTLRQILMRSNIRPAPVTTLDRIHQCSVNDYLFTGLRSSIPTPAPLLPQSPVSEFVEDIEGKFVLSAILMTLHLVAENSKLLVETQKDFEALLPILMLLSSNLGLTNWLDYYKRASGVNSIVLGTSKSLACHRARIQPSI